MNSAQILPVILSGGVGSRLWPLSREARPKPFIKLDNGESLIQRTYRRVAPLADYGEIVTVTNRNLFFYTKDEFEEIDESAIFNTFLLEPVGRNSTAAIAIAANYAIERHGREALLFVSPADHLIDDLDAFNQAVAEAAPLASAGKLVTFGVKPTAPKTSFGYIEASGNDVRRFVEKPDPQTAEEYLSSGKFYWNSGIFCMSAGSFIQELSLLCPDIAKGSASSMAGAHESSGAGWRQFEVRQSDFERIRSISVDYAIFEKSKNVAIVPCEIGWSDIGSWPEFGALSAIDTQRNNVKGNVLLKETHDCIIHGDGKLIATLGVSDLVIADTADALLVANKQHAQNVRIIVDELKATGNPAYREFPTTYRPWGFYSILQEGPGFKLKRLEIKPNASLSLQSHKHRSEHWIVVSGTALVTNEAERIKLKYNQSTYIPAGNKHRLKNLEAAPLIVIEAQCGSYLGEDDITRYECVYGRAK